MSREKKQQLKQTHREINSAILYTTPLAIIFIALLFQLPIIATLSLIVVVTLCNLLISLLIWLPLKKWGIY